MIRTELSMLAASFLFGAAIIISYGLLDLLRLLLLSPKTVKVITELVYWVAAALVAFRIQFRLNDGIIRLYPVVSAAVGLFLCHMLTRNVFGYLNTKAGKFAVKRRKRRRKRKAELQNRLKKQWKQVRIKLDSRKEQHGEEEKES